MIINNIGELKKQALEIILDNKHALQIIMDLGKNKLVQFPLSKAQKIKIIKSPKLQKLVLRGKLIIIYRHKSKKIKVFN
jgi:hypothetical protein